MKTGWVWSTVRMWGETRVARGVPRRYREGGGLRSTESSDQSGGRAKYERECGAQFWDQRTVAVQDQNRVSGPRIQLTKCVTVQAQNRDSHQNLVSGTRVQRNEAWPGKIRTGFEGPGFSATDGV